MSPTADLPPTPPAPPAPPTPPPQRRKRSTFEKVLIGCAITSAVLGALIFAGGFLLVATCKLRF